MGDVMRYEDLAKYANNLRVWCEKNGQSVPCVVVPDQFFDSEGHAIKKIYGVNIRRRVM